MKVKKIEEKNGIYHLTANNDTYLIEKPNVVCKLEIISLWPTMVLVKIVQKGQS